MTDHTDARHGVGKERSTAVLDVSGLRWASEQNIVAACLGRRPGVLEVEVNPVAQTATAVFDPARTCLAELRTWVIECGYHRAGQSVPSHICDPMTEPDPRPPATKVTLPPPTAPPCCRNSTHPVAAPMWTAQREPGPPGTKPT
ncbi:heavy-metal-associated domain-containing protein [Streptosporangium amethystogenes subsp. fukuiense]|uniref:Heavy-metal-associated domain-containing protein n=1 Tax=Streptosporangium amethystogenes subsp. fukuiense TaxID=698418 RepID=A0ABW2SW80_9ACTN